MSRRNPRAAARPLSIPAPRPHAPPGPAAAAIQQAWAFFGKGERARAESLSRAILAKQPNHAGALTLLGIILAQARRPEEAAGLLGRAAARLPNEPTAHNNYGNVLRDLGKHLSALGCYDRALALAPAYAEAHFNRGLTLQDLRRYDEALASYDRALVLQPDCGAAWNNRGTVLRSQQRPEEALSSYERAIGLRPDHAEAHNNRGVVLQELGRREAALASFERALAVRPDDAEALNNRGAVLHELKRYESALQSYDQALAARPLHAETLNNRGVTLHALERLDEALESYARALALNPDSSATHSNRGITLRSLKRFDEAVASYRQALEIAPRNVRAHMNLGVTFHQLGRHRDALASYERALAIAPDADTYRNEAMTLEELGRSADAVASYQRALSLQPGARFLAGICRQARMQICDWADFDADLARITAGIEHDEPVATPFSMLSLSDSPALQRRAAEIWVREECTPRQRIAPLPHAEHDRIRIGYFSADFRNHALAALAAELFETHDRSRFEITAFSLGPDARDEFRERAAAAFDRFLPVADLPDHEVTALARRLEIDIAVDLSGYTRHARPRIMALRAAPVQVSWLGYLGTVGGEFMDYLLADAVIVPPQYRQHYSEKIAYLPSYQPNDSKRVIADKTFTRAQLGLPAQGFVFCCFNASYKITPESFDSWMRILAAAAGSVLLLLGGGPDAERNLRRHAADRGLRPERLVFAPKLAFGEYLARYRAADLFLDTLPYNAGTTASDALWASLPVLTCPGRAFASRVAASVLTSAGLPELIAPDRAEYERLAVALATQPPLLAQMRRRLLEARPTAPLFDTLKFARSIEALYGRMHRRQRSGLPATDLLPDDAEDSGAAAVGSRARS
ncbi:MAG: tetratricopeptide repeat protein [Steroidobacteraceae bacterium]